MYDGGRRVTSAAMAVVSTSETRFERLWKILRGQATPSQALWAFCHSTSFKDGCLLAVNLGDDADTTGAVYGQLAGAFYGVDDIPGDWLGKIAHRKWIERLAEKLFDLSGRIQPS